jgi:hypothetical protein
MALDVVEFVQARLAETAGRDGDPLGLARVLLDMIHLMSPLCDTGCNDALAEERDYPTDPADRKHRIPHHYGCKAYMAAQMLAELADTHPDFNEEWRLPEFWRPRQEN